MTASPTIAVILPAYNESARIEQTVETIARYLRANPQVGPVVVADDGSSDDTVSVVTEAARRAGIEIEVLTFPHRGKALTVKSAMLHVAPRVTADYLMMLDADDELQIDQLDRIVWSTDPRTIYIGRRFTSVGSATSARPAVVRRLMSLTMRTASRILLGNTFPDTQCGFKLFPRAIAPGLFRQQRSTGWTFDAELLFIADRVSGLPIQEVPVVWSPRGVSRVRPLAAAISGLSMFVTAANRLRQIYRPVSAMPLAAGRSSLIKS